ncbi:MAG: TlpA disulfide reductase family protein [Oleibacter sp.]|nr:TlpA disulfide reductase family protein [Thalassolituus sp.]
MKYIFVLFFLCINTVLADVAPESIEAPTFELPTLTGDNIVRLEDYKNQVVYLDFWASWCAPCRRSLPMINELRKELHSQGFEVLAVNLDESPDMGLSFVEPLNLTYPLLYDGFGKTPNSYQVRAMPTSFLIDHTGQVRSMHVGFSPDTIESVRQDVLELLKKIPRNSAEISQNNP